MDFNFDGFGDFTASTENIEIKKKSKMQRIWRWDKGGSICYSAQEDGLIVFGSSDSFIYCIKEDTGEHIWSFRANGPTIAHPRIHQGRVYIGSYDRNMYCLDLYTGEMCWRFETGDKIFGMAEINEERLYFGSKDGFVYCLNLNNGSEIWRFKTGDDVGAAVTYHKGSIIAASFDSYLYRLDAETGNLIWNFKCGKEVFYNHNALIHNDIIYFPSFDGYLYAVRFDDAIELWRYKCGKYASATTPVLYDDILYFSDREGNVVALTLSGQELWRYRAEEFVANLLVDETGIYFGSEDDYVYHLDLSGKKLWKVKFEGDFHARPVRKNGLLYIPGNDCHMYCLDADSGSTVWRFATSTLVQAELIPIANEFEVTVKKSENIYDSAETAEEKYSSQTETLNLSDYGAKSEYMGKSEYAGKSEYQSEVIIFEGAMQFGIEALPDFTTEVVKHGF